jgi:AsmA protein
MEASVPSLRAFTRMFGDGWPIGPGLRDFKAKGLLDWTEQGLLVSDGQFAMDANEATGSLLLNANTARPSVSGTLAFKTLELSEYARAVKDQRSRLAAWWQWLMKDDHARSIVHLLDADLRLSADKVSVNGISIGRTATSLTVKSGRLKANVADFEVEGGTGTGEIGLDYSGSQPRMSVRGKIGGIDAARFSGALVGADALSGAATLTADLQATGGSIADISSSATGKVQVSMRDGGRVNADLKSLLAAVQKREVTGWGSVRRSATPFETLDMRLGLRGGVITIEQAAINSGEAQLTVTGAIDTAADKLDARVSFGPQATQSGKADALLLSGTLSAPRIRSEAAARAAQPTPERASQPRG